MKTTKSIISSLILLIVVAAVYRSIPGRQMGFAPQIAMALFAGAVIKDRKWAIIFPVLSMFLSDLLYYFLYNAGLTDIPGFYEGQWQNYLLFGVLVFIGFLIKKINVVTIALGSLAGAIIYFLTSNFVVWAGWQGTRGLGRPKTWDGLMMCYHDGLPFFKNSVYATLLFSAILFGAYYLINRKSFQAKAA